MKIYRYNSHRYFFAVIVPTFFMIGILVYAVINNLKELQFNIYSLMIVVTVYGIFNNVISLSNPSKIIDNEEYIEFYSFGRKHRFYWNNIKYIRIKEFNNKKIYLRIGNPGLLKGRYWIKTSMYDDGNEIYEKLTELEKKLHPNLIKFRNKANSQDNGEKIQG